MVCLAAAAAVFCIRRRRRWKIPTIAPAEGECAAAFSDALGDEAWKIPRDDIEICHRPDGSDWLLGYGSYGQVAYV